MTFETMKKIKELDQTMQEWKKKTEKTISGLTQIVEYLEQQEKTTEEEAIRFYRHIYNNQKLTKKMEALIMELWAIGVMETKGIISEDITPTQKD